MKLAFLLAMISVVCSAADLTGKWILDLPHSTYKSAARHQTFEIEIVTVPGDNLSGDRRRVTLNGVFEGVEGPGRFIVERYTVPVAGGAGTIDGGSSDQYTSVVSSVPAGNYRKITLARQAGGTELHEFTLVGADTLTLIITRGALVDKLQFSRNK